MQARVKLPSGSLICYLYFCRLIAQAVCPIGKNLEGLECVSAKIYSPDAPTRYFGTGVPYSLDEADRQAFAKVLPKLPPLRCPMLEEEMASFMEAYVNLPNRPIWMPLFETEETVLARKIEHDTVLDNHVAELRKEHRAGRIVPVGTNHVPVGAVELGAQLTREDAISYLKRHGLSYEDEETAKGAKQDALSSEAVHQTHKADQVTLTGKPKRGIIRFSAATKAKAVKRSKELMAAGEGKFAKITAKEFETSERSIYTWVKEAEKTDPSKHFWGRKNN